jgi:hypothetical protein
LNIDNPAGDFLSWQSLLFSIKHGLAHEYSCQHHVNALAWHRVRESKIRLYVAGRRVNVLLASSGCAPHCTRHPAPGVLLLGFRAREDFHVSPIIWN